MKIPGMISVYLTDIRSWKFLEVQWKGPANQQARGLKYYVPGPMLGLQEGPQGSH